MHYHRHTDIATSSTPLPAVRWLILFLTSWVLCGNFWGYDVVAALNLPLEQYLGFGDTYFQYLLSAYSVSYSLPNCILPFFGGALIDRWGPRTIAVAFCSLSTLGQLIFTLGLIDKAPAWSIFGRVLFGIGGETLSVCQQRITTKWFRGGELAMAVGVNLSIARLGSVVNDFISPVLAHRYSVPAALWGGFISCFLSLVATGFLVLLDRKCAHLCPEKPNVPDRDAISLDHIATSSSPVDDSLNTLHFPALDHIPTTTLRNGILDDISHQFFLLQRGIASLPRIFWVVQIIMVFLYGTTVPFNNIHSAFLCAKYYPNEQEYAAQIMGVPDTISAIMVPFAGYFFDKHGYRGRAIVMCSVFIFLVHFCLGSLPTTLLPSPIPPLIVLGFAYALLLTFVPVIPLIVPTYFLGTAYGISTSLANLAWAVFPVITAGLASSDPTYYSSEMFFATCGLFAIVASLYVNVLDKRDYDGVLNLPAMEGSAPVKKWEPVPTNKNLTATSSNVQEHITRSNTPRYAVSGGSTSQEGPPLLSGTMLYSSSDVDPLSKVDVGNWNQWTASDDE